MTLGEFKSMYVDKDLMNNDKSCLLKHNSLSIKKFDSILKLLRLKYVINVYSEEGKEVFKNDK
jgi:hypothetical protein